MKVNPSVNTLPNTNNTIKKILLFRDLYSWEDKRDIAIQTFNANKKGYMHVAAQGLEKDLKLA